MINLLDKFLTLLIDAIHSAVWAFKNNYLFEAWRNIELGGYEVSAKETLLTPERAEKYYLDDLKRNSPNIRMHKNDVFDLNAESAAYAASQAAQVSAMSAVLNAAVTKKVEATKLVSGFKEHVRREKRILERIKPTPIWYAPYSAFNVSRRELCGVIVAADQKENPRHWYQMMGGALGALL